ncbi:unnamed protein product [Ixodes hexagonus]
MGVVEALSDRVCIHSNGQVQVNISAEDLLECCYSCGAGCDGGDPAAAWHYLHDTGVVSGGLYNTTDGCKPYFLPPCDHHVQGSLTSCGEIEPTPQCELRCRQGYSKSYGEDKYFAKKIYSISTSEEQIRTEIFKNGPVQAAFTAYADFLSYKSGVYQHQTSDNLGGHAVRVLGWGTENGIPYWLAANSWNEDWGDHGYFKILRGKNECGIEENMMAGIPRIDCPE